MWVNGSIGRFILQVMTKVVGIIVIVLRAAVVVNSGRSAVE